MRGRAPLGTASDGKSARRALVLRALLVSVTVGLGLPPRAPAVDRAVRMALALDEARQPPRSLLR